MGGGRKWGVGGGGANAAVMSVFSQMDKPVWQASFFFGTGDKDVTATDLCGDKSRLSKRSREGGVGNSGGPRLRSMDHGKN